MRGPEVPSAQRVAVTGIGIVSPIGVGKDSFWRALVAGESGIRAREDPARAARTSVSERRRSSPVAAVREFTASDFVRSPHLRRMDDLSRMVVAASRMAIEDAGLDLEATDPESVGVVVGSALGDVRGTVTYLDKLFGRGPASASPMIFPNLVLNAPASYVAMELGVSGVNSTVSQGEVSGEHALQLACDFVRGGRADVVIAGAGDELSDVVLSLYRRAGALAGRRAGDACARPYDAQRDGLVLGEGAAMLLLESPARARARGAAIYATIEADATFGVPAPDHGWPPTARAAIPTLARLGIDEVDLVLGSANGSRRLDACEIDLLQRLLGDRAAEVSLTSIKGAVGEIGATGALTAAAACLALHEEIVPPLCGRTSDATDAEGMLRLAPRRGSPRAIRKALVLGIARRGGGGALLLGRPDDAR